MEKWCCFHERRWQTNEEKTISDSVLTRDEHPSFPISTKLIKFRHLLLSAKFPLWIIHLPVVMLATFWRRRRLNSGSRDCLFFFFTSALRIEKSHRGQTQKLKFQQRRFNIMLFRSLCHSHISFKSFTHMLIHWLYLVSCSHVSVKCSFCNSAAGLLMAWLKPNEIF